VGIEPVAIHRAEDRRTFYLIVAQLILAGACRQAEVIRAFGVSKNSVLRAIKRYREQGAKGLFQPRATRRSGTVLTEAVLNEAQRRLDEGVARREVARELAVPYDTFRKALGDGRLLERAPMPALDKSARSVEDATAAEGLGTGCRRVVERVMAAFGKSPGAAAEFEAAHDLPQGGVLCAVPALLANGLLTRAEEFLGKLRGYYRATPVLLLLAFMALCRIRAVERLRREAPGDFGRLVGLDRIPEVRCLRNKLDELSQGQGAELWSAELSRQWMSAEPEAVGSLYIDGHVRVYHGSKTKLPRKYVSRERLCLRGTSDYWVNDAKGRPFFVIERVVDSGLLEVLRTDIVPRLLRDVPGQPSEEELAIHPWHCRFTLVFDREGYSPAFFKELWENYRIACITYHKHPQDLWREDEFVEQAVTLASGESVTLRLAERGSYLGEEAKGLWVREVRKLTESGHQVSLIGTAFEGSDATFAGRLFSRWCQENFFRYMMEHFALDLLAEYGTEPMPGTTHVVNPLWRERTREKQSLRSKLTYRQARFAELTLNPKDETETKAYERWTQQKAALLEELQSYTNRFQAVKKELSAIPKHIAWEDLPEPERFQRLAPGRKRLLDTVRLIAYRAETAMVPLLLSDTVDSPAARTLLQTLFATEADLVPNSEEGILHVRIHQSSSPADDRRLQGLFDQLNATETVYPGTQLRLVFHLLRPPTPLLKNDPPGANPISQR
jgi:transposase